MLLFIHNESYTPRRVKRTVVNGRKYLLADATLIIPGVLNGSQGPLFYPDYEVARNPSAWNGIAIVVNHPSDNRGNPLSGKDPEVIQRWGIGWVSNSRIEDGKHRARLWFDEERTKAVDKRIYERLINNKAIELSTGLHTDKDWQDGIHEGRQYIAIARNYQPDHLAILPDMPGACSVRDGCGVNNRDASGRFDGQDEEEQEQEEQEEQAPMRTRSQDGRGSGRKRGNKKTKDSKLEASTRGSASAVAKILAAQTSNEEECSCGGTCKECQTHNAKTNQPKSSSTGKFKRYGSGTGKGPVHEAALRGAMMWTELDRERGKSVVEGIRPEWAADEQKWVKALQDAKEGENSDYWIRVAHIYRKLVGNMRTRNANPEGCNQYKACGAGSGGDESEGRLSGTKPKKVSDLREGDTIVDPNTGKTRKVTGYPQASKQKGYFRVPTNGEPVNMHGGNTVHVREATENSQQENTGMDRDSMIEFLTTNSKAWEGDEGADILNEMSDERLKALYYGHKKFQAGEQVVNSVSQMAQRLTGKEIALNAMPGFVKEKMGKMPPAKSGKGGKLPASSGGKGVPQGAPGEVGVSPEGSSAPPEMGVEEEETENYNEDWDEDPDQRAAVMIKLKEGETDNSKTRNGKMKTCNSLAEFERSMPPEARPIWNAAKEVARKEKAKYANAIVRNGDYESAEERKKDFIDLMKEPLPTLKKMYKRFGVANRQVQNESTEDHSDLYDFSGAAGGSAVSHLTENEGGEVLDLEAARAKYERTDNAHDDRERRPRRRERNGSYD